MIAQRALADLVDEYLLLTQNVMPSMVKQAATQHAKSYIKKWPVRHDHCFQRIVLDNVCGDAWYNVLPAPAYQHLDSVQAEAAISMCYKIIDGEVDLSELNKRSLNWRNKQYTFCF